MNKAIFWEKNEKISSVSIDAFSQWIFARGITLDAKKDFCCGVLKNGI